MSREDPQLKVRLPQELKDKITESASNLGRSINADVVARLEQSFSHNESTRSLIQDAVILAIKAIQEDPNLLNNPKVTVVSQDASEEESNSITLIKKIRGDSTSET
ncbi:Arc family DNA-binding protein [Acinetobacter sp. VNH17]|uniref:Arc family DNA-binding protein n=1 Tax=Acinetobacter thutiue TaxID=2998078 RepID=A0ABT7WKQ5_9GAMM|nr:Arc family DNA-binding protein [Acinetobacter thutiue]MCY6411170.1 Arc family DNA-binding protein [Acinetobacter thutiue]MDN0013272.1 Arc family DNA-binding protein [Acinetobacter thutiue]